MLLQKSDGIPWNRRWTVWERGFQIRSLETERHLQVRRYCYSHGPPARAARNVIRADDPGFNPRFCCGMDAAYEGRAAYVAAAVWDTKLKTIVEPQHFVDGIVTKYVPGFLAFREGPMLLRMVNRVKNTPDAFLIDGQGIAHPRGLGLASHVGLALNRPTIGVAKSRLYGRVEGDSLIGADHEVIGRILESETGKKYYVSIGHKISLDTAMKTVENCMVEGFPAPLRRAHLDSIFLRRNAAA